MKRFLLPTLFVLVSTICYPQTDKQLKNIDKELEKILKETSAAGFAVAVVHKKRIIYAKGFGYRNLKEKLIVDSNTLFAIGSSTKAFTSAILGQLREADSLSFDDSPRKYLPKLEFYNDNLNNKIIIKDLMRHSTGIPRHDVAWYLFPSNSSDSLLTRIKYHEPFTGLRQRWYYNNFMFLAQGEIAHKITGKSWGQNIKDRFFKPLNMKRSNVSIDELLKDDNRALGYNTDKKGINEKADYYRIAGMRAAGSINSSVNDMSKWMVTWINNGKYFDKKILSPAYVKEAMSSQMVVGDALPDKKIPDVHFANYGYGWFLSSYKGHYRVEHGGNIDGFSANVALYPSDSIGIVVLANQNGSAVPSMVRNTIADRVLKVNKTDWVNRYVEQKEKAKKAEKEAEVKEDKAQVKNTKPSHNVLEYTGNYELDGYGKFNISVLNDSLFANFKRIKLWLKHYHYDVFVPKQVKNGKIDTTDSFVSQFKFNFATNLSGDIASANIFMEPALSTPMEFKRTPNSIKVDKEQLEAYSGEYDLAGTTVKIYIKEDNVLYAFVPNQPEYELIATSKHKFSIKILEGYKLEFLENEEGVINAVNLMQPNGTFKATRKEK